MQVPRHTYLPLLIPEIKENMVELALDDSILSGLDEKDWWFEEEPPSAEEGEVFAGQGVCKWYVTYPLLLSTHTTITILHNLVMMNCYHMLEKKVLIIGTGQ
jgi:hypothetical protein